MRRRALVVSNLLPTPASPNRGTFNRQHYCALSEHFDTRFICPIAWTDALKSRSSASSSDNGGLDISYVNYLFPPRILRQHYGWFLWQSMRKKALDIARQFQPDIIVGSWGYPDGFAAVELAEKLSLPSAVQVLGSDINQLDIFPERAEPTWRTLMRADHVIPVSRALEAKLIAGGVPEERVSVVYRGINRELFYPRDQREARQSIGIDPTETSLLFIGNLVSVKSVTTFLSAFASLSRNRTAPVRAHIVGDGPLRGALEQQAQREGISGQVSFHGSLPHAQMPLWIAASDLVVLPSLHEGVPNVLLEAMACERRYVASRTGGIPEISNHSGCQLFTPCDAPGMTEAIQMMLNSSHAPSIANVPSASWEEAGNKLAAVLNRCIDQRIQKL